MEEQVPLHAVDASGLSLVSPSPSEALKPIVAPPHSPTGQPYLQLTWFLPPDQLAMQAQLLESLSRRVSKLEDRDKILAQEISNLENNIAVIKPLGSLSRRLSKLEDRDKIMAQEISNLENNIADIKPLVDTVHLRCLLDVWLLEQGFGPGHGPQKAWIKKNKTRLSNESGIPIADLEDFFKRYCCLGNTNAHIVRSDAVARFIRRVRGTQNNNDQLHFHSLFKSLLQHSVDEELDEAQLFVTTINSARDVNPADRKITTLK